MRLTPVRCYVLLDLVEPGKLIITRNGALEPSIKDFKTSEHPFSEKRLLTAVADLHNESMIRFKERGFHGVYKGLAEVAPIGRNRLHLARRAQEQFAELEKKHAAERAELDRRREEIAAFERENPRDPQDADTYQVNPTRAAERVKEFLTAYAQTPGVDLARAAIIQRVDPTRILELQTADLVALCDAVLGSKGK